MIYPVNGLNFAKKNSAAYLSLTRKDDDKFDQPKE